ncbi:MAG TPA: bifunctional riboflavin kinase/FAD synthetase [Rhodanobacteraceae bacterium]|nr:bifunctional riboflavin kinase/FAD synthetase [Rhodanobacteraceae bacterium]
MIEVYRDAAGSCLAPGGSVVAVGAFDGLHVGHRELLARVRERARARSLVPAIVSFEPLPRAFFAERPLPRLASRLERIAGLDAAGIKSALMLRFDAALAAMSAESFVREVLLARLGTREVHVGENFRFGHQRRGDLDLLRRMGAASGFEVRVMAPVEVDGERVSSSRIRALLAAGEFDAAAPLLGRPFSICGRVAYGNQLGRTLGFPTANIHLGSRVSPIGGIFAVRVGIGDESPTRPGVASLGTRPTVNGSEPLLEAHLFDFTGDLYGRRITVAFAGKLRDETKFDDLDAMVEQMHRDAADARAVLGMDGASTSACGSSDA